MAAQNSAGTAKCRGPGRPFPKGVSGNPGGRPRGLVAKIRLETREGEELVAFMLRVFRNAKAKDRDRMEAATWLADRGFGRPVQTVETTPRRITIFQEASGRVVVPAPSGASLPLADPEPDDSAELSLSTALDAHDPPPR